MKHRTLFILVISAFIIYTSCRKNKDISISGKITNILTGKSLSNVEVLIDESYTKSWCIFGCTEDNTIANLYTNTNGEFSYSFTGKRKREYTYKVHLNDINPVVVSPYWFMDNLIYPNLKYYYQIVKEDDNNLTANFNTVPAVYLKIRCNNISPYDSNDLISVFYSNAYETQNILSYTGTPTYPASFYSNTAFFRPVPASEKVFLRWDVKKNNISNSYYDTIAGINPFDTLNYIINY